MTRSDSTPRLLCLGELLVDMVPERPGLSLRDADTYVRAAGGAPANVAVAASRLGATAGLAASVGADPFGTWLEGTLSGAGVDTTFVLSVHRPTAVAFVGLSAEGDRDFLFYGDAPAHFDITPEHATAAATALARAGGTRVLHFGSVCLAREPARSATAAAIDVATAAGCLVSVDVNLRESFWDDLETARDVIWSYVERANIVKLSAVEAAFLAPGEDHAGAVVATRLLAKRATIVVVSRGATGAVAHTEEDVITSSAPVVRAVDTTGAGDALCGAVLAATLEDPSVWSDPGRAQRALTRACAYAALSTTARGAIPSYVSAADFDSFEASLPTREHPRRM